MATLMRGKIEDFSLHVPLVLGLKKLGTKSNHWEMLSERIHTKVRPRADMSLSHCLELGLQNHMDDITHVVRFTAFQQVTLESCRSCSVQEFACLEGVVKTMKLLFFM